MEGKTLKVSLLDQKSHKKSHVLVDYQITSKKTHSLNKNYISGSISGFKTILPFHLSDLKTKIKNGEGIGVNKFNVKNSNL